MTVGRPPKPKAIKELNGNPGKRKLNQREPNFKKPVKLRKPKAVQRDKIANDFWNRYSKILIESGVMTTADEPAFRVMAHHYSVAIEALADVNAWPLIIEDKNGSRRKNPSLQVWKDNSKLFLQWAQQFGMTPSSRSRLAIEPGDDDESIAAQLFRLVNESQ